MGSDVAGSRPYRPGDDVDAIDWASSAKLSAARGQDEFIVRERYADEAPHVVCVLDRRPSMSHMAAPLPWLSKPDAMRISIDLVTQAATQARSLVGYVDFKGSEPTWSPPTSERETRELGEGHRDTSGFDAPANAMSLALAHLAEHRRSLPSGSFVFLFSDFVEAPSEDDWLRAIELRWDIVPVVIQDPVWEQTFPYVDNIAFPFADPRTGRVTHIRMNAEEANARREHNEHRLRALFKHLRMLGVEPILVSSADPQQILLAFSGWTEQRIAQRGAGW
jgi:uncharacterized protein (DUF58 family)